MGDGELAPLPAGDPPPDPTDAARWRIAGSDPAAYFPCELNGVRVELPRDTLRTMLHCVFAVDGGLVLLVETQHLDWLRAKLRPGDVFLDVGSSTGAMVLPVRVGPPEGVTVVAFEPARTARRLLTDTLARNRLTDRVEVHPLAVSDAAGECEFAEIGYDPSDGRYFLPETSQLANAAVPAERVAARYPVAVTTLDRFFAGRADAGRVRAVKIDVEGFEGQVLRGGAGFVRAARPYLAIDIHPDPFGPDSTEAACVDQLSEFGYTFERLGHVLLCTPPAA